MKWLGKSPITVGEVDEQGNPVLKRTFFPGDDIPPEWLERMRQPDAESIDDKGKYNDKLVKAHFDKNKS